MVDMVVCVEERSLQCLCLTQVASMSWHCRISALRPYIYLNSPLISPHYTAIMSLSSSSLRPLASIKQAIRQCRAEKQQFRRYAVAAEQYPSLQPKFPLPTPGFRPSQAIKQNRMRKPTIQTIHRLTIYRLRRRPQKNPRRPTPALNNKNLPRPHRSPDNHPTRRPRPHRRPHPPLLPHQPRTRPSRRHPPLPPQNRRSRLGRSPEHPPAPPTHRHRRADPGEFDQGRGGDVVQGLFAECGGD